MVELLVAAVLLVVVYELTQMAALAARELSRSNRNDVRCPAAAGGRGRAVAHRCPGRTLASDEQRDRTTRLIAEAMADGRLGIDEGIERIEAALVARHTAELDVLESDLPPSCM